MTRRRKHPPLESYNSYLQRQGIEHCAICGKPPGKRRLDRDHNHKTGEARGLLCNRCNRWLPKGITSAWCSGAALYLEEYGE